MSKVAIARCSKYEYAEIKETVEKLIANTDFPSVEGKTILVKPNILSDSAPEKNITTNPFVVKAVIEVLKERNAKKIYVGDSPALPSPTFSAKESGIKAICDETGVQWVDFFNSPKKTRLIKNIYAPVASILFDVDMVFSICKMKTHQLMKATGAVKNMFGVIPGLNKSPLHLKANSPEKFAKLILGIYNLHVPEFALMDAIISMEGPGPSNGTLRNTGLLLASSSCLALDRAEAIIMGYKPEMIPILKEAEIQNPGCTECEYTLLDAKDLAIKDYKRIETKGQNRFESVVLHFVIQKLRKIKKPHAPEFDHEICRRCRKCINICPAKALEIIDGKVTINKKVCIRCYCCHEVCPFDAIKIK